MTLLSLPTLDDLRIEPGLPTVVSPRSADGMSIDEVAPLAHAIAADTLERAGGVLFTGFRVPSIDAFQRFAASFGDPLIGYEYASTPRSQVEGAVYTSTEYPPHRAIPLHNEQSYTREWPLRIWFHCALAAQQGGATPIADSRAVYRALDPALVARFEQRELLYVRNFGQGSTCRGSSRSAPTIRPRSSACARRAESNAPGAPATTANCCCARASVARPSRAIRAPASACGSARRTCFTCPRSTTTCRTRSSMRSASTTCRATSTTATARRSRPTRSRRSAACSSASASCSRGAPATC
jgi:hypothetical protein